MAFRKVCQPTLSINAPGFDFLTETHFLVLINLGPSHDLWIDMQLAQAGSVPLSNFHIIPDRYLLEEL